MHWLRLLPFLGGGSVVVDSVFIVALILSSYPQRLEEDSERTLGI